jgi:hypothetical protein
VELWRICLGVMVIRIWIETSEEALEWSSSIFGAGDLEFMGESEDLEVSKIDACNIRGDVELEDQCACTIIRNQRSFHHVCVKPCQVNACSRILPL